MKLKDIQNEEKEKLVPFVQRVRKETKDYLNKNRISLEKIVEILKNEEDKDENE